MSLDKAIEHGKERRKIYRGAKSISPHCRNHGGCPACESNRVKSKARRAPTTEDELKELVDG